MLDRVIKCVIIDDEKPARDEIEFLLKKLTGFQVVGSFENGKSFLERSASLEVDILFVDVNMPGMSGIDVVEALRREKVQGNVVFITAYDEFAIRAFELNAADYLLKPVSQERFENTLKRIAKDISEHEYDDKLTLLLDQFKSGKLDKMCLHRDGKIIPVLLEEIIYMKAENKGIIIESQKGNFMSTLSLTDFENKIGGQPFFRCHRSFIINLDYVKNIEPWFNRTYQVELEGSEEKIPVSRNYVQLFKELMNIF